MRAFLPVVAAALVAIGAGVGANELLAPPSGGPAAAPMRCSGPGGAAKVEDSAAFGFVSGRVRASVGNAGWKAGLSASAPARTLQAPRATFTVSDADGHSVRLTLLPDGRFGATYGEELTTLHAPGTSGVVCIGALAGSAGPVALAGWWSGGAHCCEEATVVFRGAKGRLASSVVSFGNPGFRLEWVGGALYLVGGDDRFSYFEADFADSIWPVTVQALVDGRLVDRSRGAPAVLRADADKLWSYYLLATDEKHNLGRRTALDAWLADECRLGSGRTAWQRYLALYREGAFTDATWPYSPFRSVAAFGGTAPGLRETLEGWGYCGAAQLAGG
ncbi:MAG TPA: hypothetical protein VNF07_05480 [Acidimicrobiales bacterium]|nr:hypothetical protein [Acidimicrobiales bacterium]